VDDQRPCIGSGTGPPSLIAPFAVSDFAAGRSYRLPIFLFVVGGSLVLAAVYGSPVPYRPGDLPEVVMRVIASFLR
jgi:ABC-type dipeptide/oligopeptide/nickel transport system permease subunit